MYVRMKGGPYDGKSINVTVGQNTDGTTVYPPEVRVIAPIEFEPVPWDVGQVTGKKLKVLTYKLECLAIKKARFCRYRYCEESK